MSRYNAWDMWFYKNNLVSFYALQYAYKNGLDEENDKKIVDLIRADNICSIAAYVKFRRKYFIYNIDLPRLKTPIEYFDDVHLHVVGPPLYVNKGYEKVELYLNSFRYKIDTKFTFKVIEDYNGNITYKDITPE